MIPVQLDGNHLDGYGYPLAYLRFHFNQVSITVYSIQLFLFEHMGTQMQKVVACRHVRSGHIFDPWLTVPPEILAATWMLDLQQGKSKKSGRKLSKHLYMFCPLATWVLLYNKKNPNLESGITAMWICHSGYHGQRFKPQAVRWLAKKTHII